jgi:TRAP-type C4-dicarboxylate transport system permease small subunit
MTEVQRPEEDMDIGTDIEIECECGESNIKKPENWFDKITVNFYSVVCFVTTLLLAVIISAATFVRYILQGDLYGYEEWIKLFAFWLYFMGAAYGAFAGTHISADLVHAYLDDGPFKRFLVFLKCLITVGVMALFTWYGWDYFYFGFVGPLGNFMALPKTTVWRIPLWTSYLSIFLGLLSMLYYFTRDLIHATRSLVSGGKKA